ncbi:fungal-specific transcription factor domain-containing protein [Microdochium trichocladiopsis]|uniref:Fungal-specific transcription factor domain-containing protein n=1 Tax=Microdochium trichocladiopsis TaxID=1682393 RepID=A0A9P8YCU6_9PEZI|nr:fungal-specific transcription factor domain-containing protein [Microdochium trichocladiopsis]KAH7036006.1 fungal-specific transcription factor domain-containing protein [Microdochium trichocladiopsis]
MPPALGARRVIACQQCHLRKVRCDAQRPKCGNCVRGLFPCSYPPDSRQHRGQQQARLEDRIRRLEAENSTLRRQEEESRSRRISALLPQLSQDQHGHEQPQQQHHQQSDVASQVIHLSLSAGGGRTYVGSTSGLFLANLLQPHTQQQSPAQHRGSGLSPSSILIHSLPAESLAREIKDAYAAHDHLIYPIIPLRAMDRAFDTVYNHHDPSPQQSFDGFVVDMVLAIGTAQLSKLNWNGVSDAEVHYNRAMSKANPILASGGLPALQAILLICHYRMGTSSHDTTNSVWHLVGVAARTCYELGLHKNATYQQLKADIRADADQYTASKEREEQIEARFNCFWCTVALDRVASLTLGRPLAMQLEDIDVDLMALQRDQFFTQAPEIARTPAESRSVSVPAAEEKVRRSIFTHIVKYRVICGKVLNALHRSTSDDLRSPSVDYTHIRDQLAQELQAWHADTASAVLVAPSSAIVDSIATPATPATTTSTSSRTESLSSFRSTEWYDLLYHNGNLMLFRPSPSIPDTTARNNSTALQRTFDSSRAAITLYASLHQTRKINYSWVTLHSVFMAGLSYIYALRTHFQHARQRSQSQGQREKSVLAAAPSIIQVVNDTRACSKVLVAVSERWASTTRNCSEVFDKLSDAVVADVVEAQTRSVVAAGAASTSVSSASASTAASVNGRNYAQQQGYEMFNMTVDNTLRDCYTDIQNLFYDQSQNDAIARLSQDWLFGIEEVTHRP